jgi:magnesium chelatase accessory protein
VTASLSALSLPPEKSRIGAPDWSRDGRDWPNRENSHFFSANGLRLHVQIAGAGPAFLLLHGTGAATHSWRDLLPLLAEHFLVIAPDLPGHGFSARPGETGMTIAGMSATIAALLTQLGQKPEFCAGHSAGAAILVNMILAGQIAPKALISLNGALLPFKHAVSPLIAPLAKMFARSPLVPFLFSMHAADPRVVERLLRGTGSEIDAEGAKFYARLAARSVHAGAALTMMANWDLPALLPRLKNVSTPTLLIAGGNDKTIAPDEAAQVAGMMPNATVRILAGLGHLAHEEQPEDLAKIIEDFCQEHAA